MLAISIPRFSWEIFSIITATFDRVHEYGGLTASIVYPQALGILRSPAEMGVDFIVGEAQSLGLPLNFGGPYIGFFATKKEFIRKISGRIVGETVDEDNTRGYVLTLTAREQHIRREKATSNICTNQGLNALRVAIYLSLLGKSGIKASCQSYAIKKRIIWQIYIDPLEGFEFVIKAPFFNEFTLRCPVPTSEISSGLSDEGILAGFELGKFFDDRKNAVTDRSNRKNIKGRHGLLCENIARGIKWLKKRSMKFHPQAVLVFAFPPRCTHF